jgi:transposase InsO family protein
LATEKKVSIGAICRQLGYSKQAYYKSIRLKKLKSVKKSIIKQKIMGIRREMPRLGTRKLYFLLKESFVRDGISIGRDRLFDLLREEDLLIIKKKKYTKTTDSKHWMHKYPNLVKGLELRRPEQVWVADITYMSLTDRNCYLHLITDAYSKLIMGYCVSESLAGTETLKALEMALKNRRYTDNLIHHSDRGLQYCSAAYVKMLEDKNISISMTQDGNPYDNAIAERVNGILKDEFGLDDVFEDHGQLELQVAQSISTYNNKRPHESNYLLTPFEMHQQDKLKPKAWHKKSTRTFKGSYGFLPSLRIT